MMPIEKAIQIRGNTKTAFRRIERSYEFLGRRFTISFVRIDPSIEHAVRTETGDKEFSGTLLIDKDET